MEKDTIKTAFDMGKSMTTYELQKQASRSLCALIHTCGTDAVKGLALQMISSGGNNRLAVECFASQFAVECFASQFEKSTVTDPTAL